VAQWAFVHDGMISPPLCGSTQPTRPRRAGAVLNAAQRDRQREEKANVVNAAIERKAKRNVSAMTACMSAWWAADRLDVVPRRSSRWVAKEWRSACSVTPLRIPAASAPLFDRAMLRAALGGCANRLPEAIPASGRNSISAFLFGLVSFTSRKDQKRRRGGRGAGVGVQIYNGFPSARFTPDSVGLAAPSLRRRGPQRPVVRSIASWMHEQAELFMRRFTGETFDPEQSGRKQFGRGGKIG
jgi:hypothetical protein